VRDKLNIKPKDHVNLMHLLDKPKRKKFPDLELNIKKFTRLLTLAQTQSTILLCIVKWRSKIDYALFALGLIYFVYLIYHSYIIFVHFGCV
jgi:hypothetical protein